MGKEILGIHHVTAIAGDPQQILDFYTGVFGLRLVKLTVNYDDPQTCHLYYGDAHGTPGTILTFFPWRRAKKGRQGHGQVIVTAHRQERKDQRQRSSRGPSAGIGRNSRAAPAISSWRSWRLGGSIRMGLAGPLSFTRR